MSSSKSAFTEIISDIQDFIDESRNPQQITGRIISNLENNKIKIRLSEKLYLSKGTILIINNIPGLLMDYNGKDALIEFESPKSFLNRDIVNIDTTNTAIILNRLQKSIDKIENNELNPQNIKILNFLLGKEEPLYDKSIFNPIAQNLNENQYISVKKSLNAKDFHLIVGPPGTGKTFVIEEIIRQLALNKQKVMVTAWTNLAVDNILERISGFNEDMLLRVGSKNGVNLSNQKYSIFEKRKNHKDWNEIENIDNNIINKKKELKPLFDELSFIKNEINKLKTKKSHITTVLKNTLQNIEGTNIVTQELTIADFKKGVELANIEKEMELLEFNSEEYILLAKSSINLKSVENSLPDSDEFYLLESELNKMRGRGLVKKVSSIFNKSNYEQFQIDLTEKENAYNEMVNKFNNYWDLKDGIDEKFDLFYNNCDGNPEEDALLCQLDLCRKLNNFIILKKESLNCEMYNDENKLLLDSFQVYKESLENKAQLSELKIKKINTEMFIKIRKKDEISRAIDNIKASINDLESDKLYLTRLIDNEIYDKARFIFCTVISSASHLIDHEEFDVMIMDEASQVASYMSLIPLLKCKKFILVGDDNQLEPIGEINLNQELNQSIFNKLIEKYPYSKTFLDIQYRMNKNIANLASLLFYNGKLKTYPPIENQKIDCFMDEDIKKIIAPESPITFIDTSKIKFYEDGTNNGCENTKEAIIINKLVSNLIKYGINTGDIGIISPFAKQREKIKEFLENDVEVDTVHRFQGREKDLILMSFCKSKMGKLNKNILDFIGKPAQLNVAITRARKKLIIIGNLRKLKQSKILRDFIKIIGDDSIVKLNEKHLKSLDIEFQDKNN